ncbi:MAG: hypothetical protein WB421_14180, partial [Terriglobales bacterium]
RKSTPAEREAFDREIEERARVAARELADFFSLMVHAHAPAPDAAQRDKIKQAFADDYRRSDLTRACLARDTEDELRMTFELTKLAFALTAYRTDRGKYPGTLTDLSPTYCAVIPKDIFSDGELRYFLKDGGCVLYSVGPNRKDDGGLGVADRAEYGTEGYVPWDDITVRLPAVKKPLEK